MGVYVAFRSTQNQNTHTLVPFRATGMSTVPFKVIWKRKRKQDKPNKEEEVENGKKSRRYAEKCEVLNIEFFKSMKEGKAKEITKKTRRIYDKICINVPFTLRLAGHQIFCIQL